MRGVSVYIAVIIMSSFLPAYTYAAMFVSSPQTDTTDVTVATPTIITVSAQVGADPALMPGSVKLVRYNPVTNVPMGVLTYMYDDGTHGDIVADDDRFTGQPVITADAEGPIYLRVTAAYSRVRTRFVSGLIVLGAHAPTEPLKITVDQGASSIDVEVEELEQIAAAVSLMNTGGQPYTVEFSQTVTPDNGGVALEDSDYAGPWVNSVDMTNVVNVTLTGCVSGTYTITATATVVETGLSASSELIVNVLTVTGPEPKLWQPGADPDGIAPNTPTEVLFTVRVTGLADPLSVQLEETNEFGTFIQLIGDLVDDGTGGDLSGSDGVYSQTFQITSPSIGKRWFRAKAEYGGETYVSEPYALSITELPVGTAPPDAQDLVEVPGTSLLIFADEIFVAFKEGVTEERILEIVSAEGGTIIDSIPSLGIYEVRITGDGTVAGVAAAIEAFQAYSEVRYAEGNVPSQLSAFPPDGSESDQWALVKVRADEAWVVARATNNFIVAVVDTGVDYTHPDLTGRVIVGRDFVNGDDDPMDEDGHGTEVAGIIAATHDGSGATGIAFGCRILAVRVGLSTVPILNIKYISVFDAAKGIRFAADRGAHVINMSFGAPGWLNGLCWNWVYDDAIAYARKKGCLLVAAAGNENTDYASPAVLEGVVAVGGTGKNDARSSFSNYGPWVDIAAPAEDVYTTSFGGGTVKVWGTSFAAPLVSGAAAVIWSMHPEWSADKVREKLIRTAKSIETDKPIGGRRLDLFEAVFNGSFEAGDLSEWWTEGTCSTQEKLGPLMPTAGKRMGYCSTGPSYWQDAAELAKEFTVQPGVTSIPIKFDYDFVTEEYPEWVGTIFDDTLVINVVAPDGTETLLATETVNTSLFTQIWGIDFPGGDDTVGHTTWRTVSANIPVTQGGGRYSIVIMDMGDDIYDSVVLIDNIRLK